MKTKLFILTIVTVFLFLSFPLFGENFVIDNAAILSANEKANLERRIQEIAYSYNFNLIILTEVSIHGSDPIDYSWNYLFQRGLNGENWNGSLLLVVMGDREYWITASGRGDKIMTQAAFNKLEFDLLAFLRQNNFAGAYENFIDNWEIFLGMEARGRNYNFLHNPITFLIAMVLTWLVAIATGSITIFSWKRQMNTAIGKKEADSYIVPGSLAFTKVVDQFLYSTVSKVMRPKSSSSSGGSRSGGGMSSRSGRF